MYKINKNVYFVLEAYNACIYDLNSRRLIPIEHDTIPIVQQLFLKPSTTNNLFHQFYSERIIVNEQIFNSTDVIKLEKENIEIAWIEINTSCNFRCIHCYVDKSIHTTSKSIISKDDFIYAIDQLVAFGIHRLHIIGGEPLLHPHFWELMEYALPKFDFSVLFTNGYLLDKDSIHRLIALGLSEFDLSLYSTIQSEHEKVTLKAGSYKKTLSVIKLIEETNAICHIATVRVPGINIGKPYNSHNKNPAVQHLDYMRASGRGQNKWNSSKLLLGDKAICQNIINRKVDPQKILFKMKYHNCFGRYICINPELYVYPCTMERRFYHGNLREHCLSDLIKDNIRTFNKDNIKGCCFCEYRYICSDCRPDTFSPNIYAKPWFCKYNPLIGKWDDNSLLK